MDSFDEIAIATAALCTCAVMAGGATVLAAVNDADEEETEQEEVERKDLVSETALKLSALKSLKRKLELEDARPEKAAKKKCNWERARLAT